MGTDGSIVTRIGNPDDGATFYVYLKGITTDDGNIPEFVGSANGLTGGRTSTSPRITVTEEQAASNNQLYEPIPSEFLFTYADFP